MILAVLGDPLTVGFFGWEVGIYSTSVIHVSLAEQRDGRDGSGKRRCERGQESTENGSGVHDYSGRDANYTVL